MINISIKKLGWDWDFEKSSNGALEAKISSSFSFSSGSAELKTEGKNMLDRIKGAISRRDVKKIRITGHTDSIGSAELNKILSEKRAFAVASYLIKTGALKREQIVTEGKGSSVPIADNGSREGRSKNRRVELIIIE